MKLPQIACHASAGIVTGRAAASAAAQSIAALDGIVEISTLWARCAAEGWGLNLPPKTTELKPKSTPLYPKMWPALRTPGSTVIDGGTASLTVSRKIGSCTSVLPVFVIFAATSTGQPTRVRLGTMSHVAKLVTAGSSMTWNE